ncbi:MAG: family 10 glycosylhydrolase [Candidatus Sumerlaeaceae bacterium]|nr:family 10 glycosylhydrolase [Candidatus Sumerlaeaceae bacterium]
MSVSHRPVAALLAGALLLALLAPLRAVGQMPAPVDYRAIWFTTVQGLDFPAGAGTSDITAQRAQIVSLLDTCQSIGINAVLMQVRTECDAFYVSAIEPWSRWLTGAQGTAPARPWDPLQFMVDECRRRGMEIHAWFNPYRAGVDRNAAFAASHPVNTQPHLVVPYSSGSSNYYWLNPGHPGTIPYTTGVIMDVVDRYDIDGIHFDDYFYPYGISTTNPFPDSAEYAAYTAGGGTMSLGDWRRDNVNRMISTVRSALDARPAKNHVRFGISPFGIWKTGVPPGIVGLDAYSAIFADSRKWLVEGWVDYFTPQLYWGRAADGHPTQQDFDTLLNWWTAPAQNPFGRPIFPGLPAYKALNTGWQPAHVVSMVNYQQSLPAAQGSTFFRTLNLTTNGGRGIGNATVGYLSDQLRAGPYQRKATTVAYTHRDATPPAAPTLAWTGSAGTTWTLHWTPQGAEYPQWYVVYWRIGTDWSYEIVPDWRRALDVPGAAVEAGIQALDRLGNRSTITTGLLAGVSPPPPPAFTSTNVRNHDSDSLAFLTTSGSNIGVSASATVSSTEEANNRLDPRVGAPGANSRKVTFNWTNASGGRYRLSTFGVNPAINLTQGVGVYIKLLGGRLDIALAVRETGGSGPIGANGGSSGPIEMTAVQRVEASPNWQYIHFDLPNETWTSFASGNGVLDGTWGVLESLMIYQVAGAPNSYTLYIDEIHQGGAHTPLGEPVRPRGLTAQSALPSHVVLSWAPSPAQDLAGYRVYRSTTPVVARTPANLVAQVTTPSFTDTTTNKNTLYYYTVTAVDHFGYESAPAVTVSQLTVPVSVSRFTLH